MLRQLTTSLFLRPELIAAVAASPVVADPLNIRSLCTLPLSSSLTWSAFRTRISALRNRAVFCLCRLPNSFGPGVSMSYLRFLFAVLAFSLVALFAYAVNPVPFISDPLVPASTTPGSSGLTLTVNGTGFVSGSVVNWNGSARTTIFVSSTRLTAAIAAADVATATTATVTVVNPGVTASNPAYFVVTAPASTIGIGQTVISTMGGTSLQASDVNNDGKLDLVSIGSLSFGDEGVVVQLGNGDGTFQSPIVTALNQPGVRMVLGDFNNDGRLDAVVHDFELVWFLPGNGDGTFQAPIGTFFSGTIMNSFAAGDFNQDGKLDLAVGNAGQVRILLGNGDGTFQQPTTSYSAGNGTSFSMALGDFNLDGKLDIVVTSETDNSVAVLLGNGDGTMQNGVEYATTQGPVTVAVADLNADGKPDLAVISQGKHGASNLSHLLGNGDGTFQTHVDQIAALGSVGIALADYNGDGKPDIATTSAPRSLVLGWFGMGNGSFSPGGYFPDGPQAFEVVSGDFNRDGKPDLATLNQDVGLGATISVLLQGNSIVSPTNIAFGTVKLGSSKSSTVTLTNSGTKSFAINGIALAGNTTDYHEISNCGSSLAAGASCRIKVTFQPTSATNPPATLNIVDGGIAGIQGVALTGRGQ